MTDVATAPSSDPSPRGAMALSVVALVAVVGASLFSFAAFVAEGGDVPQEADYQAVAAALDDNWREGEDLLTALPAWTLRPFVHVRGKERVSGDNIVTAPLHRGRRLWVIAEPDSEDVVDALQSRFGSPEVVLHRDRIRLLRFAIGGPEVVHDLRADLAAATVELQTPKGQVACPPNRNGVFQCAGRKRWQKVERAWALVTENSSDVLYAHPPPKGEKLVLRWPAVRLGEQLVLRAGFFRSGADKARAPVHVKAFVDDTGGKSVSLGEVNVPVAFDLLARTLSIPSALQGQERPLRIEVSTKDNASAAFGIDAYTVAGAAGPADALDATGGTR